MPASRALARRVRALGDPIQYAPQGFGANDTIGPHQGLRVTFAETRSMLTPDFVESADFRDNLDHLVAELEQGGYDLAPASDITVAPGELAATIDFAIVKNGFVTVAAALEQLQGALYGPLDFLQRTYIRRVEKIDGQKWGDAIPDELDLEDKEKGPIDYMPWILGAGAIAAVIFFAPEIKTAIRGIQKAHGDGV